MNGEVSDLYRKGWNRNGEWQCAKCGTMIGKNLLGDKPFLLARQHATDCVQKTYNLKRN